MPFVNIVNYGIVNNPLTHSLFGSDDNEGGSSRPPDPADRFLLLTNRTFFLLDGQNLSLL